MQTETVLTPQDALKRRIKGAFLWSNPKKGFGATEFSDLRFSMEHQIQKKVYNHKNTRCHPIMNEGRETANDVICSRIVSTVFESVPSGTLRSQIQKIRIWIESTESFLEVCSIDSKSFFFFYFPKGTHPNSPHASDVGNESHSQER